MADDPLMSYADIERRTGLSVRLLTLAHQRARERARERAQEGKPPDEKEMPLPDAGDAVHGRPRWHKSVIMGWALRRHDVRVWEALLRIVEAAESKDSEKLTRAIDIGRAIVLTPTDEPR